MSTSVAPPSAPPVPIDPLRATSRAAGWWFLATFVFSIPALAFYAPVTHHADYVLGGGHDAAVRWGAMFEILLAVANIATAVVLFPVLKRWSESVALGYVASRILESTVIVIGLISLLSVVTLRSNVTGATGAAGESAMQVARALVAVHRWTFLLGPAFCAGIGNGILLGSLMYRSGLMPRRLAMIGLVGGPLAFVSASGVVFGAFSQTSSVGSLLTAPEAIWELTFGLWMVIKGFDVAALASRPTLMTSLGRVPSPS
jgi:hypothetical protein